MSLSYLQEITRKSVVIAKNEETLITWCGTILTVRTDKGIHILELSCNLDCLDKNIDCLETAILTPKCSPATSLLTNKIFKGGMRNIDYTEMLVDSSFWAHNVQLMQEMTNIIDFKCSPPITNNNGPIIAVLNNVGNVVFYISKRYCWDSILNLSSIVESRFGNNFQKPSRILDELRKAVYTVETCAICWGPAINKKSCYFVSAQKNGNIIFWLVQGGGLEVKAEILGEIESNISETVTMLWIPKVDNKFILICSNVLGQLLAFDCQIDSGIKVLNSVSIWEYKDRMVANYLEYDVFGNKIILVCNKYRHLLVQMLDENCKVISQIITNVNDYKITTIAKADGFFLGTVNSKIYRINISVNNENIDVTLNLIEMKDSCSTYELYSMSFSKNRVICAVGLADRRVLYRKEPTKLDVVFLSTDNSNIEVTLLNNPTKKLTNFWDCIEYLRYKTMKQKCLPEIDYKKLYSDAETDIYKLKIYLIFAIFYNNLEKLLRNGSKGLLPETSIDLIREKILALHSRDVVNKLYDAFKKNGKLNDFESESLGATKQYLEYYCKKYKKQLSDFMTANTLKIVTSDFVTKTENIEYTCQCCDETLEGLTCKYGHINMFCSLSFTLIETDDYIICKYCNCTARTVLQEDDPLCIFCDMYMSNCCLPS